MYEKAEIDTTGHSGRVALCSNMFNEGFQEKSVKARSGHRSDAVRLYMRENMQHKQKINNVLQSTKPLHSQGSSSSTGGKSATPKELRRSPRGHRNNERTTPRKSVRPSVSTTPTSGTPTQQQQQQQQTVPTTSPSSSSSSEKLAKYAALMDHVVKSGGGTIKINPDGSMKVSF